MLFRSGEHERDERGGRRLGAAGGAIEGIPVESDPVRYPIAALSTKPAAAAFVAFVLSERGQGILQAAGFGAP